jgi:hypothetical protein
MKQEQRLVAELYRYLAPFISLEKDIYLSLDGQAAKTAVAKGRFTDAEIPDLWFTLIGSSAPTRLEAKILCSGKALLMQSQIRAWRSSGTSSYRPNGWVAANRDFDQFYYWRHDTFVETLDRCTASQKTHNLAAPKVRLAFPTVAELALHVLRTHSPNQ